MSERIHVKCENLRNIFNHVTKQIPKGNRTVNVAFQIESNELYLYVLSSIMYRAKIGDVDHSDHYQCVQYHDICAFIGDRTEIEFVFEPKGVTITVGDMTTSFFNSYDLVSTEMTIPHQDEYIKLDKAVFIQLKTFSRTFSTFKLYKKDYNIIINEHTCSIKTPSIWFKGVCSIDANMIMTPDIYSMFLFLSPSKYVQTAEGLYVCDTYFVALLPVNATTGDDGFSTVHKDYKFKSQFSVMGMQDIITAISNMQVQTLQLAFDNTGLAINLNASNVQLAYHTPQFEHPAFTCEMTKDILCYILRLYQSTQSLTVYAKSNLLCFFADGLMSIVTVI